jgi:transposase
MIRQVKRATRKRFSAEDKIRIVLEGFRKELPVSELCRRESIHANIYYYWLKDFMEAGKARLQGDTLRDANRGEVKGLKKENEKLKAVLGEMSLELILLKKSVRG